MTNRNRINILKAKLIQERNLVNKLRKQLINLASDKVDSANRYEKQLDSLYENYSNVVFELKILKKKKWYQFQKIEL